ncbi:MAG: hypothetical protein ACE5MG_10245, partial [Candidatus Methylomirabilales bacterium]
MRFRRFGLRYLDFQFSVTNGVTLRIVERPGLWMSSGESLELVGELRSVVDQCLGPVSLPYGVLSGAKRHLDNAVITVLFDRRTHRPMAFNTLYMLDVTLGGQRIPLIHLGLGMIHPAFRSRGLSWVLYVLPAMLLLFRHRLKPFWISNVTQVPLVVGKVAQALSRVYPTPDPSNRKTEDHLVIARELMCRYRAVFGVGHDAGFDEDRFIITNAYTGGSDNLKKSFAEVPKHRDEAVNVMCQTHLDYDRGDDFLQIGRFHLRAASVCLLRAMLQAWPSALASLLWRGSRWPAPAGPTGHLRP